MEEIPRGLFLHLRDRTWRVANRNKLSIFAYEAPLDRIFQGVLSMPAWCSEHGEGGLADRHCLAPSDDFLHFAQIGSIIRLRAAWRRDRRGYIEQLHEFPRIEFKLPNALG